MTVAIAVVSADGIVMAADSRTTVQMGTDAPTRVLSDFTHKVFQVGSNVVATYGWAFLQQRNVAGHMVELEAEGASLDVEQLANHLKEFFGKRVDDHIAEGLDPAPPPGTDVLGFLVGGYKDGIGHVYEALLPTRKVEPQHDTLQGTGAAWRGQTGVIGRLVKGVDWEVLPLLAEKAGKDAELAGLMDMMNGMEFIVPFESMNLQDSIDFAVLAIRTTIDVQRLTHGYRDAPGSWPGVGGPMEIAVVTAAGGFRWLQRTELQGERPAGEAERI
jgi:hypothetical protein